MQNTALTKPISEQDLISFKNLLKNAFKASSSFNGTSDAERKLFSELEVLEEFYYKHGLKTTSDQQSIAKRFNNVSSSVAFAIDDFLSIAGEYYDELKATKSSEELTHKLAGDGVVVIETQRVLVQTDNGQMMTASSQDARAYEVRIEPRLATLLQHLATKGVNGNQLMNDDLVITKGSVADNMMRQHPYYIVQIPSIDMEIAVCDQVGEVTFVKEGTVGLEFWEHYSKDGLKARNDVCHVIHTNEAKWLADITEILSGHKKPHEKINTLKWARKKPNLDIGIIKESLLAHREATGQWLSSSAKTKDGTIGSYILEYGPYAGQFTVTTINSALHKGLRGLPGGSSIPKLNQEISDQHGLDYNNKLVQNELYIDLIKESLLAHRLATGQWIASSAKTEGGKKGSYILEYGPYKGDLSTGNLDAALAKGLRGLPGGSSIAKLNQEISDEHGFKYNNILTQGELYIDLIKESLLAHRLATGQWIASSAKTEGGTQGSYILEHGPYAGQFTVTTINSALREGLRGLPGGSSIPKLNQEISDEHGLDYQNRLTLGELNIDLIKESLLAHRLATGQWLSSKAKTEGGTQGSYILEYGPYKGDLSTGNLQAALVRGLRGLPGGSSIPKLNQEISDEHGFDYRMEKRSVAPKL